MKLRNFSFLVSFLFGIIGAYGQEYLKMIDEGDHKVSEIVAAAEEYFADRDQGRGSGYKQFKRWEYMANRLKNEAGYLRSIQEDMTELETYNMYINSTASDRTSLNASWSELGPDYYNATTAWSPGVGRITGISIDATNTDHIIASANTGGVWKTVDGGNNWQPLNDNFTNLRAYAVAIDPSDPDVYYFGSSGGIIFKSTDAGSTWSLLADLSNSLINKILIHPTNSQILFASSQNAGIYKSMDGGNSWQSAVVDTNGYDIEFKPGDPSVVYATGLKFHRSIDGGVTFTAIGTFPSQPKMLGVSIASPEKIYMIEADGGMFGGFYTSTDEGTSFTEIDQQGLNYFGYSTAGLDTAGQAPRDMDIAVNPNDSDEIHIAGVLTWRSLDGGVSFMCTSDWVPNAAANANLGYCHADVDFLTFSDNTLFVGTDGGIFKATNTTDLNANYYEDLTTGMGIRQFYKLGVSQTPELVITGGSQDNGSSFYTPADGWKDWIGADGMEGFIDKNDSQTMYGMIQFGGMYRTLNGGQSLSGINEPGPGSGEWVTPFEQDPSIPNTIYVGYNRVYKSSDRGNSWTPTSQVFGGDLDHLKIAASDNQVMYAANNGVVYKTIDGGATNWTQLPSPGGWVNSIAIHPTDPNKIAVASTSGSKVRVSDDGGQTWQTLNQGLPNFSALAVLWDDNGADALYLGMDYGIYYIDNTFAEWQPYASGLPNVIINELEIHEPTQQLYAASYGRGLWVSDLGSPSLGFDTVLSQEQVRLYPNPGDQLIQIQLSQPLNASIRVFDTQGKLVIYHPKSDVQQTHSLEISKLVSGIYFVRVETSAGMITKKLIKK